MKVLHTQLARSIWLFDTRDMNPSGRDVLRDLIPWIVDSYHFSQVPDLQQPYQGDLGKKTGLVFENGRFLIRDLFVAIHKLTIFDDGIVIEAASSTEDADTFANDLLKAANTEFGLLIDGPRTSRHLYVSQIVVRSDLNLAKFSAVASAFAKSIPPYPTTPSRNVAFELAGLSFWTDTNDAFKHAMVRIERQVGKPFTESRYFSEAPFQTKSHIALLEDFETLTL
jgi:hypothetical protein